MGMPAQQAEWTAEMARALPEDGNRYEVLDGELFVSPAPQPDHQSVVVALVRLLDVYVRHYELGWVFTAPADIEFSPRRFVQPDVFVVRNTGQGRPRTWQNARPLSLVAEVRSDSTARADRFKKRVGTSAWSASSASWCVENKNQSPACDALKRRRQGFADARVG